MSKFNSGDKVSVLTRHLRVSPELADATFIRYDPDGTAVIRWPDGLFQRVSVTDVKAKD